MKQKAHTSALMCELLFYSFSSLVGGVLFSGGLFSGLFGVLFSSFPSPPPLLLLLLLLLLFSLFSGVLFSEEVVEDVPELEPCEFEALELTLELLPLELLPELLLPLELLSELLLPELLPVLLVEVSAGLEEPEEVLPPPDVPLYHLFFSIPF